MNIYERTFVASSELFSGFSTRINITFISTLNDICNQFKKDLKEVLKKHKFENLIKQLDNCNFHIHSYTIEDILLSKSEDIFYVCDHC